MELSANFPNYSVFQSVNFVHKLPIYISWSMSHRGEPMTTNGDFWGLMGTKIHGDSRSNR